MALDTDEPLILLAQVGAALSPSGAVLLVLGALTCLAGSLIAYAASSGKTWRQITRDEFSRTLIAMALAVVLGAALLYFGLSGILRAGLLEYAAGGADAMAARRSFELMASGLEIGNAIWPALLLPALGALLGVAGSARSERTGLGLRLGQLLAEALTAWLPRPRKPGPGEPQPEEADFEITMASGEEVEAEEREYIENILELGETTAHEVMTPRPDVTALDVDWEPERVLALIADSRFSRFPIYEESIDNVIGVLHLREVVEFLARGEGAAGLPLRELMIEPFFVPDSRKIDDVLRDLQRRKGHMAIVLDEFGGTAGILTIEDLLEEIVGEIQDEYDDESKPAHQREDGSWVVDAQFQLDDLNELLGLSLEAEDVDTLGGFVTNHLGHIPKPQETVSYAGLRFTVLSVEKNRLRRVAVERVAAD